MFFGIDNIRNILISVPITLIALSGHELAHAWVSTKLGDPTPKMEGRLTLNPMAHLDLIGTLLMILTGFGWAKPVMINPMYYKNRTKGMALVAVAGPLANFLMAFVGMLIGMITFLIMLKVGVSDKVVSFTMMVFQLFAVRNLCFMVFNLIPIPPLDGFKVLGMFLPQQAYYKILQYEHFIMYGLMFLCITGVFSNIIGVGVNAVYGGIMRAIQGILAPFF